jgi:anti-sigma28 factor (negative regulator of flagellin synthesis)
MRIDDHNAGNVGGAQVNRTQGVESQTQAKKATGSRSSGVNQDHAQLSGLAEKLRAADSNSTSHAQRLQKLAEVVKSGKYEFDAGKVGESLINEAIADTSSTGHSG